MRRIILKITKQKATTLITKDLKSFTLSGTHKLRKSED